MLSSSALRVIQQFPLGFVATVDAEGRPCVSPKGTFLALDDKTLAFSHIRSPQTLANLKRNPGTEINFVDPVLRKGARVRGDARIVGGASSEFATLIPRWFEIWGDLAQRVQALVIIKVTEASDLSTPPYDDGVSEADMIALYMQKITSIYPVKEFEL